MKYKTTQKAIRNGYDNVICVGYCSLQYLLNCSSADAYTTRREGWGADIYDFGNTAIVTGYAPFGNIRPPYDVTKQYDDKARAICDEFWDWDEREKRLDALIAEFIEEVTK